MIAKPLDRNVQAPDNPCMVTPKTPAKERLVVEATPELRRQVEAAAEYEGLTLSSFIRRVLTLYIRQSGDNIPTD